LKQIGLFEMRRLEALSNTIFSVAMTLLAYGLYGVYRLNSVVAVSYGFHLIVIASLNALLWILVLRGRRDPELLTNAVFPVFVFVFGTVIAVFAPFVAQFTWNLAFGAPLAGWLAARRW
jgi:hypothetical protein